MNVQDLTSLRDAGDNPWPDVSPDFDARMLKALETGMIEDPKTSELRDLSESTEKAAIAADISFVPLDRLRDVEGRPVVLNKRYLFREADRGRDRMTDFEDNNLRRVVNNAKWHDGIWLKLSFVVSRKNWKFHVEYPGRGKWLDGTRVEGNDVTLSANRPTSNWMFEDKGHDKDGHQCYAIWAERWGAIDYGGGFWMPDNSVARAGYDKDHEWRTYSPYSGAKNGWFNIKFERVDYNE